MMTLIGIIGLWWCAVRIAVHRKRSRQRRAIVAAQEACLASMRRAEGSRQRAVETVRQARSLGVLKASAHVH